MLSNTFKAVAITTHRAWETSQRGHHGRTYISSDRITGLPYIPNINF